MWAKNKHQPGFTIVELLIVIVVIAILAAISIVAYNGVQQRGRDSERISDINAIRKSIQLYYVDNTTYPTTNQLANSSQSTSESWAQSNLQLPPSALRAPGNDGTTRSIFSGQSYQTATSQINPQPTKDTYTYLPTKGDGAPCNSAGFDVCANYNLYYFSEVSSSVIRINN